MAVAVGGTTYSWNGYGRALNYEEVYLHAYDSVTEAKRGLEKYFTFYNQRRPHTALDDKTPDEFYFDNLPTLLKAA